MIPIINYNTDDSNRLMKRLSDRTHEYESVQSAVSEIISDVKKNKDEALFRYTKKFDGIEIDCNSIRVTEEEIHEAYKHVDERLLDVIRRSALRIKNFHQKQKQNSWLEPDKNGEMLGQLIRPLHRVGVYVPGGKAAYPSSVLMNVVPAKVAGVEQIIMTTPPGKEGLVNHTTVVAAVEAGVTDIYKIGGAQAIAALAFGTESIPKTDKIVGPGNIYVALAKRSVYGYVNIDSVAGPSEILIIADETANAVYAAADLLSQAEHDELASSILITTSKELAVKVTEELERQTELLERKEIIKKSLADYGAVIIAETMSQALEISNIIAPEHLEICAKEPFSLLPKIQNAGAIFLGNYSPEPLGDYMAGPNHVLPTGGTARFFSPLSVDDYIKKSSIISFNDTAFKSIAEDVIMFAESEGLTAHANSIKVRL